MGSRARVLPIMEARERLQSVLCEVSLWFKKINWEDRSLVIHRDNVSWSPKEFGATFESTAVLWRD